MRAHAFAALSAFAVLAATVPACTQTPVVVPLRSMERPKDVDFICLRALPNGAWEGASLEKCAATFAGTAAVEGEYRLHALVTQLSRGELAVVDVGRVPGDSAGIVKVDPRVPGYSFLPVSAVPADVAADPAGKAVYVASGRDPRIHIVPAALLRGPIDTAASQTDDPPWPRIELDRVSDGVPSALSIVREGGGRRLYVTLPDAKPASKIAVFDLGNVDDTGAQKGSALAPARVGDITLTLTSTPPVPWQPVGCGPTRDKPPWWSEYDRLCFGGAPAPVTGATAVGAIDRFHLAGVAVAGGKLFVADDVAPVLHVFDVEGGRGIEVRRIPVGSATSRLAVSPPVPDEVTPENLKAADTCLAQGWLGDGLDHSADSPDVKDAFGGRCRLHRYIYAIDLVNTEAGSGSIAVFDLPVTYGLDASNKIKRTPEGLPAEERIALDAAEQVQPMACDAPNLPPLRIPVGPFGVGGANTVPARAVSFFTIDPPRPSAAVVAGRCRPRDFAPEEFTPRLPPTEQTGREIAGREWRDGIETRRLRGVFAFVALSNGAVVVVDIDDYDATCRGPVSEVRNAAGSVVQSATVRSSVLLYPGESTDPVLGRPFGTGEYYPRPVRRHHPRSLRKYNSDVAPLLSGVALTRYGTTLLNDPTTEAGSDFPHFAALDKATPRPSVIVPSPDNPFAISNEAWTVTYEGPLLGYSGTFGALDNASGALELKDVNGIFCRRGVEDEGPLETHDMVQLLDPLCPFDSCTPAVRNECADMFGEHDAQPLARSRSLFVEKAYDDRLVLSSAKRWVRVREGNALFERLVDGPPDLAKIRQCFGAGLLKYTIRPTGTWTVIGTATGYLHRRIVDPASSDKACITDPKKPHVHQGRLRELPFVDFLRPTPRRFDDVVVANLCERFVNPSWQFAVRAGRKPSVQDMRFSFTGRFPYQPFSIGTGVLTTAMRPVAGYWDGKERLNWNQIAVVDAVEGRLFIFPAGDPYSFQKVVN